MRRLVFWIWKSARIRGFGCKQDKINDLERQVAMASLSASQTAQTAKLIADNTAQTQYIVNRVAPYPIPSYTVPNPFVPAAI